MRWTMYLLLASVTGVGLFWFGYGSALAQHAFGISDAIVGSLVGGLLTGGAAVATTVISRDSTRMSILLANEMEAKRTQREKEEEDARELITQLDRVDRSFGAFRKDVIAYLIGGPEDPPNLDLPNESASELITTTSSTFPELDDLAMDYRQALFDAGRCALSYCAKVRFNNEVPEIGDKVLPLWDWPDWIMKEMREYLVDRFIRKTECDTPSRLSVRFGWQQFCEQRQFHAPRNEEGSETEEN